MRATAVFWRCCLAWRARWSPRRQWRTRGPAWGACPADVVTKVAVLQCATVPVPLDYREPEGEQIEIMVSRLASTNPGKRRGVLMLNPGGPGGSGLSFADDLAWFGLPASVLDSYDLIGMDTRGIGHSAPVSCGFTAGQDYVGNIPPYAVDEAAVAEQAKIAQGSRRAVCRRRQGRPAAAHVDGEHGA